jgi:predicted Zn-dependent protease
MQSRLSLRFSIVTAAVLLAGCSTNTSHSLLKLEDEKAEMNTSIAEKIGATPLEVEQALDETPEQEQQTAALVTKRVTQRVGVSTDLAMQNHLQAIAMRLARAAQADADRFEVVLLASDRVNAYTPGAGTLLINEGLLRFADNEAQVAAVMAHEIAHVVLKHPQRQKKIRLASKAGDVMMTHYTPEGLVDSVGRWLRIGGRTTMNGMIRQQEMMADSIGIDIMVKAGYDPVELVKLLENLRSEIKEADRTTTAVNGNHPLTSDRIAEAKEKIRTRYRNIGGRKNSVKFAKLVKPYHEGNGKQLALK